MTRILLFSTLLFLSIQVSPLLCMQEAAKPAENIAQQAESREKARVEAEQKAKEERTRKAQQEATPVPTQQNTVPQNAPALTERLTNLEKNVTDLTSEVGQMKKTANDLNDKLDQFIALLGYEKDERDTEDPNKLVKKPTPPNRCAIL